MAVNFKWHDYFQKVWDVAEGDRQKLWLASGNVGVQFNAEVLSGTIQPPESGSPWLYTKASGSYIYPAYNVFADDPLPSDDATLKFFGRDTYNWGTQKTYYTAQVSFDHYSPWFWIWEITAPAGQAVSARFWLSGAGYSGFFLPDIGGADFWSENDSVSRAVHALVPASITDPSTVTPSDIVFGTYFGDVIANGEVVGSTNSDYGLRMEPSPIPVVGEYDSPQIALKGVELNSYHWIPAGDYALVLYGQSDTEDIYVSMDGTFLMAPPGLITSTAPPPRTWQDLRGLCVEVDD
jgi:hypothetical protein